MSVFDTFAIIIVLTAGLSFLNYKYLKLERSIGLMLTSLIASLCLIALDSMGFGFAAGAAKVVSTINFSETLLKGVLCFILFAGALHIELDAFWEQRWAIGTLSTLAVLISTAVVGAGTYYLLPFFGFSLPIGLCLLFGALISPTDPIAVLALLKRSGVKNSVGTKVAGEALLNDGVGVVVFLVLLGFVTGETEVTAGYITELLLLEVVGGIALGLVSGYAAYYLLKRVDEYRLEILISVALVVGAYSLANALHMSGPLAIVAAGLLIGNRGRAFAMSEETRRNLDLFWEVIDDLLNAVFFVLVGLEVLILAFMYKYFFAGLCAIMLVLAARLLSVWFSSLLAGIFRKFSAHTVTILTWGGLRGGISLALALALPRVEGSSVLLCITYVVVSFSIIVQGLTFAPLLKRLQQ